MKQSRELLKVAGIVPKLRLAVKKQGGGVTPTGPHRVKLLEDKIVKGLDRDSGKEVEWVKYILEENGEKKFYQTKVKDKNGELSYLVQRMAEVGEGEEVIMECKRAGLKNFIEVTPVSGHKVEVSDDDISDEDMDAIRAEETMNEMEVE